MKKTLAVMTVVGLLLGALAAPSAVAGKKKKKKAGPVVVGTDPAGDWGAAVDPTLAPVGDALGQDLVEATLDMADKETVNFIIKVNSLPAIGGAPEITRYTWNFNVDGEMAELDGKFTNYSRGACDPTAGSCPPPRDPGQQPFALRGNCTTTSAGTNVTTCEELGLIQAAFDAGAGTITIPVPLDLIEAKHGSKIAPGVNIFGGSISAAPSAFLTSSVMPLDTMVLLKTFKVSAK